ncbi:Nucleolar protein [Musa troglodytarum]|uniref:Nucleolar protein n=1 Tax=Musa troglodytarum TaxID=320322 RepID=A0A9E7H623_9LILI|nr:Nucleolar protein [Musa troglodytarum]
MVAKENGEEREDRSSELENDVKHGKDGESDYEPARDSLSLQGETPANDDSNIKRASRVPKKLAKKETIDNSLCISQGNANHQEHGRLHFRTSNTSQKKFQNPGRAAASPKNLSNKKLDNTNISSKPSSEVSEETDNKAVEEVKEIDVLDEAPVCDQSNGTDDETVDTEENVLDDDRASVYQKIEEMESRIEKLEEELREVAALEISLYSVIPEHGSSAHKVHTPARRLSRLYIHACKYWTQDKKATVARNIVSGLVLIAKSCGNDVSRLTFWLSNTVVLREIIFQTFGNLSNSTSMRAVESNGGARKTDEKHTPLRRKNKSGIRQGKSLGFMQLLEDWQDTSTFTTALAKIESWIFSRIVESVWWQTLTPHMQSPSEELYTQKNFGSVQFALEDMSVAACLYWPERLDVAMFNAILRESAHEIPTDPVSDPIVDPKVLPIPAGDLSFGSGAQLKNSIGNWSRWLTDVFGMDAEDSTKDVQDANEEETLKEANAGSKSFHLLNELCDLLMLPKDMLLDRTVRKEVCPSIGLPLITRILCNFTPDEFCPDPVPGVVLEELNTESILEMRVSDKEVIGGFPCAAAPVVYLPPSADDVAEKVGDAGGKAELQRRGSMVQRKGYTSDEDLDVLDTPLAHIMDKTPPPVSPSPVGGGHKESSTSNSRYDLLREVWCV